MPSCRRKVFAALIAVITVISQPAGAQDGSSANADLQKRLKQIKMLGEVAKERTLAWYACQRQFSATLARNTPESMENVILATFAACRIEEQGIREAWSKIEPAGKTQQLMDRLRQMSRESLTLEIIGIRRAGQ